ncbi:MAG TPA: branched-chain amino acid ABC transporter permease, partial [Acidimicrobiia bacterium]|nr:branched-chain amino acid ABC transporter permease [Acidimicrobiia bacterium]
MTVAAFINGIAVGGVAALLAVGISQIFTTSGVLNFAHASMAMVCAYVNFDLIERAHLPVGVALLGAVAFGALLGMAAHRLVFVPVARTSQVVKLLASFGLAGVLQGAAGLIWRRPNHPNPFGHSLFPIGRGIHLAGASIPWQRVGLATIGIAVALGLAALVRYTEFGIQVRALAQNPLAARLAGVNDRRIERRTWAIAGATAAVAGV